MQASTAPSKSALIEDLLSRTFSQGYGAQESHAATLLSHQPQRCKQASEEVNLRALTGCIYPGTKPAKGFLDLPRKSHHDIMEAISVSSSFYQSESIAAVRDVLVDPEIAGHFGFWGDVGSPQASPSRASSGAESISGILSTADAESAIHDKAARYGWQNGKDHTSTESRESAHLVLLPWDM